MEMGNIYMRWLKQVVYTGIFFILIAGYTQKIFAQKRPNILFIIDDDIGYAYTGADGAKFTNTPTFDKVASNGILFTNDYATAPQCAPARASILTGQYMWQNGPAGTHFSTFPAGLTVYTDILEQHGYAVGHTGKGWGPGSWKDGGRTTPPAGPLYEAKNKRFTKSNPEKRWTKDISKDNYAASFKKFLNEKEKNTPFCFWFGGHEPHRPYVKGSGLRRGKNLDSVNTLPPYLPNVKIVKSDYLDYAVAIEWFDQQAGKALEALRKRGELKNTIVIYTSDHGPPFPRAKALSFNMGTHIPLAIMWKGGPIKNAGRKVNDLVSMVDVFPTILQAAGLKNITLTHANLQGRSLFPIFKSKIGGWTNSSSHEYIYWGRERHTSARWGNFGYPQRAIRSRKYLYIWNLKSNRWPAGAPKKFNKSDSLVWAYEDIDDGPTKSYMIRQHAKALKGKITPKEIFKQSDGKRLTRFQMSFGKFPEEMLYNVQKDPYCLHNLADDPKYHNVKERLSLILKQKLKLTDDPRLGQFPNVWNSYRRYGIIRTFPEPKWEKKRLESAHKKFHY
jgi:uncharacterized sulfatase